jgi:hypothetical protein
MEAVKNDELNRIAKEVRDLLEKVINRL